MGQGMDGMNESWEPEEIDEPQRRRVNTILPETEQLRVEADGLYKRAKKAEEKNKTLTAERDQLRAEVERLNARVQTGVDIVNAGVAIMTTEQVGQWAGVRSWLEQPTSDYFTDAEQDAARAKENK